MGDGHGAQRRDKTAACIVEALSVREVQLRIHRLIGAAGDVAGGLCLFEVFRQWCIGHDDAILFEFLLSIATSHETANKRRVRNRVRGATLQL